jgi:antirestriction protein
MRVTIPDANADRFGEAGVDFSSELRASPSRAQGIPTYPRLRRGPSFGASLHLLPRPRRTAGVQIDLNPKPKDLKMENKPEIKIYVACLASYNNGILHGAWIDAHQEAWSIYDGIRAMLETSPIAEAEEWAIHDYEGFDGVRIAEYAGLASVAEIAAFIAEHGRLAAELIEHFGGIGEAREAIEGRYHGAFASLADYMQDITEECTAIPASLQYYIDWQAMARDAEMSGDLFTIQTAHDEIHVFAGG